MSCGAENACNVLVEKGFDRRGIARHVQKTADLCHTEQTNVVVQMVIITNMLIGDPAQHPVAESV